MDHLGDLVFHCRQIIFLGLLPLLMNVSYTHTHTHTVYTYMFPPLTYHLMISSVQSLSRVRLIATPWTAARQASLSITNSQSLLKLMSIESVMPSNRLILCCSLLLLI